MNVLFVSYWGLNEGLTQATVIPHLRLLATMSEVESIHFVTIERTETPEPLQMEKLTHRWVKTSHRIAHKLLDKSRAERLLADLNAEAPFDWIIARSSLAARLVKKVQQRSGALLSIESFEPHAQYMVEDGVWERGGLKYQLLHKAEQAQKKSADFLLPLTENYRNHLLKQDGVNPHKMMVMPCCVNVDHFKYNASAREEVRKKLALSEQHIIGIYTGKFGGMYMSERAIELFIQAKRHFGERYFLIILSPDHKQWSAQLLQNGFEHNQFFAGLVAQPEMPRYLSAADFAFSLHRPTPGKIAISPIKNGEYLASGLPIVMPVGIGDDAEVVSAEEFGVTFHAEQPIPADFFSKVEALLKQTRSGGRLEQWARAHRSFYIVKECYRTIMDRVLENR